MTDTPAPRVLSDEQIDREADEVGANSGERLRWFARRIEAATLRAVCATEKQAPASDSGRIEELTDAQIEAIILRHPFVNMNALDRGDLVACIREVLDAALQKQEPTR